MMELGQPLPLQTTPSKTDWNIILSEGFSAV